MRLLPPQARRSAIGLVVLSVAVVAVGAALYHGQRRGGRLDDAVDDWLFTLFGRDTGNGQGWFQAGFFSGFLQQAGPEYIIVINISCQ